MSDKESEKERNKFIEGGNGQNKAKGYPYITVQSLLRLVAILRLLCFAIHILIEEKSRQ